MTTNADDVGHAPPPPAPWTESPALTRAWNILFAGKASVDADVADDLLPELQAAIDRAKEAEPETITCVNPTSHPIQVRMAVVAEDRSVDTMYQMEWIQFAVSHRGRFYIVYRYKPGPLRVRNEGDYVVEWSTATTVTEGLVKHLPPTLAEVISGATD